MSRWTQYDEVSYRIGGMERVGYDADSRRSYFQEGTELYEGQPGVEFGGELRHIGTAPPCEPVIRGAEDPKSAWRQLAPFLLIIGITMLLLLKYFSPFSYMTHTRPPTCREGLVPYEVLLGDSCWSIANRHGWQLDKLDRVNPQVSCDPLLPGSILCVPPLRDD